MNLIKFSLDVNIVFFKYPYAVRIKNNKFNYVIFFYIYYYINKIVCLKAIFI